MGLEVIIEQDARDYAKSLHGLLLKWVSPGNNGVPDRIVTHINCGPFLMEFKAPEKRLNPTQIEMSEALAAAGFRVYAGYDWWGVNSIKMAREIIYDEIHGRPRRHPIVSGL